MSLNPILQMLEQGSSCFAPWWRAWVTQFTQPQILRLAEDYLGARLFHSSQIGGFSSRRLRDPAPRVFLAVGYLNVAHARSLGIDPHLIEEVLDIGLPEKLPDHLRGLWEGREPLRDASQVCLGPVGLFEAFTGLRELGRKDDRHLAPEHEAAASEALGRFLRLRLAHLDIDWLAEMPALRTNCAVMEELLMGQTVRAERLVGQLPKIGAIAQASDDELWELITSKIST
jgi:hypothetical protein